MRGIFILTVSIEVVRYFSIAKFEVPSSVRSFHSYFASVFLIMSVFLSVPYTLL